MKKNNPKILMIVFIIVIITSARLVCQNSKTGTLTVLDVARDTSFDVSTLNFTFPSVLKLRVHANLNDSFEIGLFGKFKGGALDTSLERDHYSRKFDVKYIHYKASSGSISIKYDLP
jgi:hypothetical protein